MFPVALFFHILDGIHKAPARRPARKESRFRPERRRGNHRCFLHGISWSSLIRSISTEASRCSGGFCFAVPDARRRPPTFATHSDSSMEGPWSVLHAWQLAFHLACSRLQPGLRFCVVISGLTHPLASVPQPSHCGEPIGPPALTSSMTNSSSWLRSLTWRSFLTFFRSTNP